MANFRRARAIRNAIQQLLYFSSILVLVWFSDNTLIDSIYLSRVLGFAILTLLLLIIDFQKLWKMLAEHPFLILLICALSAPVLFGFPYLDKFYGESQRINGTFQLILIVTSMLLGLLITKAWGLKVLLRPIIINGAIVSIVVIASRFITLQVSTFAPWEAGNGQGGINENFKSMFIAISCALHLVFFKSSIKSHVLQYFLGSSLIIHLTALAILSSLQGFLLIVLAILFFSSAMKTNLRFGIPIISVSFFIGYFAFVAIPSLAKVVDSSTLERINLARRAIEMLNDAPLITPNPFRISENDFSDVTLTKLSGTEVWIDDVHNVFLNAANTLGILFLAILLVSLIILILDYLQNVRLFSWETSAMGAITIAISLVLIITILNPIYSFPFCILIGGYIASRNKCLKQNLKAKVVPTSSEAKRKSLRIRMASISIAIMLVIQLAAGTFAILREYTTQKETTKVILMNRSGEAALSAKSYETLSPLLLRSRDLRFIYEVGRYFYLQGNCAETGKIKMILRKRSSNHFLTKKLGSLYDECVAR